MIIFELYDSIETYVNPSRDLWVSALFFIVIMKNPGKEKRLVALSSLSLGQKAVVVAYSFDSDQGEQIQKLGLDPGEKLEVVRLTSPVDQIEIKIREYFISLSHKQADHIMVTLLD